MTLRSEASDNQSQVDELFAEYLLRVDRGETIDRAKFLRQNSDYAEILSDLMEADELLRQIR